MGATGGTLEAAGVVGPVMDSVAPVGPVRTQEHENRLDRKLEL